VPHINSILDLFDVSKIYLNHPNTLGYDTRKKVLQWRKQQLDALELSEYDPNERSQRSKQIMLSLPPAYYLS